MDVGTTLRNARERRGLSIESLSHITRINPDLLRAIESNAFDKVPGGIFLRGFLRSYAREVSLDPELVVRWYVDEFEAVRPEASVVPAPARDSDWLSDSSRRWNSDGTWRRWYVSAQWAAVAIVVAAFAGWTILVPRLAARGSRATPPVVPAGQSNAMAQPAPVPREPDAVATAGSALQVDIAPTGPCWISATADGQRVAYGVLQSGDRRTIAVHEGLELRVGDPATFGYTINGVPGRVLGRPAEPVTVTIAPANFREFLARN